MIITLVAVLFLAIAGWTTFSLMSHSAKEREIKLILKSMLSNVKDLSFNLWELVLTLFNDSLQKVKEEVIPQEITTPITDQENETGFQNISETSLPTDPHPEIEKDEAIASFSPEVIELINDEEEKAA